MANSFGDFIIFSNYNTKGYYIPKVILILVFILYRRYLLGITHSPKLRRCTLPFLASFLTLCCEFSADPIFVAPSQNATLSPKMKIISNINDMLYHNSPILVPWHGISKNNCAPIRYLAPFSDAQDFHKDCFPTKLAPFPF